MKIDWLTSGADPKWIEDNYLNGGAVYETYVRKLLKKEHELEVIYLSRGNHGSKFIKYFEFMKYFIKNFYIKYKGNVVIRDPFSTVFAPFDKRKKNIVMLHHLDFPKRNHILFYKFFKKRFFDRARLADRIVVVSKYWKKFLEEHGCSNIVIIYNSFDLSLFKFDEQELTDFKTKLGIPFDKPIFYLGNAKPEKGFIQSYKRLKSINAVFVTSGRSKVDLPVIKVFFSYNDYLKLLKISTIVITMSKFNEGWCRTAHEAMLCGTPVIGSGVGGMEELLTEGGQMICDDFLKLGSVVMDLLQDREKLKDMSIKGREFAQKFSLDYFKQKWLDLVAELSK
jgi:glycosyltransferase involved in cell wall biosynthesis